MILINMNKPKEQNEQSIRGMLNAHISDDEKVKYLLNLINFNIIREKREISKKIYPLINELSGWRSMIPNECAKILQKIRDIL